MKGYLKKLTVLAGLTMLVGLGMITLGGGLGHTWVSTAQAGSTELALTEPVPKDSFHSDITTVDCSTFLADAQWKPGKVRVVEMILTDLVGSPLAAAQTFTIDRTYVKQNGKQVTTTFQPTSTLPSESKVILDTRYKNAKFEPIQDTQAFATCP